MRILVAGASLLVIASDLDRSTMDIPAMEIRIRTTATASNSTRGTITPGLPAATK